VVFTGTYEHAIDAKNRLAIPARIRTVLQREAADPAGPVVLYVVLAKGNVLCLYTEREFSRRAEALEQSERHPDEVLEYEQFRFSLAEPVELDSVGRVRLPDQLLQMAGVGSDVVVLGVKDHLQIRDRQAWYDYRNRMLKERPDMLMNPRQVMRRPAEPKP
jgi:MraZ protein